MFVQHLFQIVRHYEDRTSETDYNITIIDEKKKSSCIFDV